LFVRQLIGIVLVVLGIVAPAADAGQSVDCMERFPEGRFGIPLSHPAATKVMRPGFSPLYLVRQAIGSLRPEDCQYVYTGDVFRIAVTLRAGALLAGCIGDFDGDGRLDVALLLKRQSDGLIVPFVFLSRMAQYEVTEIEPITDPDGFAEDQSVWPGPYCIPKPSGGVFKSWVDDDTVKVVGDLFTIGWKTYFWNPAAGRFESIFTTD
jgi:hypothetical protein